MDEFNWGEEVSAQQLGAFVLKYTDYRLTIITPSVRNYANNTFTGSSYVLDTVTDRNMLTPQCRKKTLYLVWSPTDRHFAAVSCASKPFKAAKTEYYTFCHKCIKVLQGGVCECTVEKKKETNIKVHKACPFCLMTPCIKKGCSRNCKNCGITYKYGFDRKNGSGKYY